MKAMLPVVASFRVRSAFHSCVQLVMSNDFQIVGGNGSWFVWHWSVSKLAGFVPGLEILESAWILKLLFQGLESAWISTRVLEKPLKRKNLSIVDNIGTLQGISTLCKLIWQPATLALPHRQLITKYSAAVLIFLPLISGLLVNVCLFPGNLLANRILRRVCGDAWCNPQSFTGTLTWNVGGGATQAEVTAALTARVEREKLMTTQRNWRPCECETVPHSVLMCTDMSMDWL